MSHRVVAAGLQYVVESQHVTLYVGIRVLYRIAHPSLCRQVHHDIEFLPRKKLVDLPLVGDIHLPEYAIGVLQTVIFNPFGEKFTREAQFLQTAIFERNVIIVVQVVDTNHGIASFGQHLHQIGANEPCGSRNQSLHIIAISKTISTCYMQISQKPLPPTYTFIIS